MGLPRALKVYLALSAVLLLLSLAACWRYDLHGHPELGSRLINMPSYAFDYWDYLPRYAFRHTEQFYSFKGLPGYEWYYPAPAIFALAPFYHFDAGFRVDTVQQILRGTYALRGYHVYVATTLGLFLAFAVGVGNALRARGLGTATSLLFVAGSLATAWPVFFALQRGNVEALTWMLIALALWAFASGRLSTAAILIGLAGAIKLYPILFVGLFIKQRRIYAMLFSMVTWAATTVLGLWFLDPHVLRSLYWTIKGIRDWTGQESLNFQSQWDHSAFGLIKKFTFNQHPQYVHEIHVYYVIAASVAIVLFVRVLDQPFVNQVLFLSCAAVTLPPTSFDYTLCLLFVPLAVLSQEAVQLSRTGIKRLYTVVFTLLAIVIAPELFLNFDDLRSNPGAVKAVCLILLMLISSIAPLAEVPDKDLLTDRPSPPTIVA